MKKFLLLVISIALFGMATRAQYVTIPDAAFASYLQQKFPGCMNGNQLDTTCQGVIANPTTIIVNKLGISDLTGVQYFDNLEGLYFADNNVTSLPPLPNTVVQLNCTYNNLSSLPALPSSLVYLWCNNNQLSSLPDLPSSLKELWAGYNQLDSVPLLPTGLIAADVSYNNISSLQVLPANLDVLFCEKNNIAGLPALPAKIRQLGCSQNPLTNLPTLPSLLEFLSCSGCMLTSLPSLPSGIYQLDCNDNKLSSLPALPAALQTLNCDNNLLQSLPALPGLLTSISCSYNLLSALPVLPGSLESLYCTDNNLNSLPVLPDSLKLLSCGSNLLSSLPVLPASLQKLHCSKNQLTFLPTLPLLLKELSCSSNQLTGLPALPAVLSWFWINNNPSILCMPPLKQYTGNSSYFAINKTGIRCLPNVIKHSGSIPQIDTMPICGVLNQNGCEVAWNIQGNLYNDVNADCKWQNGEAKVVEPVKINLYQGNTLVESFLSSQGSYSFNTVLGTYRVAIDTPLVGVAASCKIDTTVILSVTDSLRTDINFGLHCQSGFDVGVRSIFGNRFRPATNTLVKVNAGDMTHLYGMACAAGISGALTLTITGPAQYVSVAPGALAPASATSKVVVWNVTDFGATSFDSTFNLIVSTDTFAQIGQQVCFTVSVAPLAGDNGPDNNTLTRCYEVRTSFDPNDKQAYPAGNTDTATKWLTYTVRFQNTGNDTALNIYILDTLSSNVDASTFQLLSASHENITQVQGNGIVRFNFPDIMLPDSNVNEELSHGYVQYRVKLKSNLSIGTQISNTAYIYFDFNEPVVTNTTVNTLTAEVLTAIGEIRNSGTLHLYPNPANNTVFIAATGMVLQQVCIYDLSGRKVYDQAYTQQVDINALTPGVYFVEVRNPAVSVRQKLVKL